MTTKNTEQTPDGVRGFFVRLGRLDRRWIFLAMGLSIAVPILLKLRFPEVPGPMARATFDAIESLPNGSRVLLSFDFDPASKAELQPMANALVHHCASKDHKIVFMALWPLGKQMADQAIKEILLEYHDERYAYGTDYVQLGFKAGNEGVIKLLTTNIAEAYATDDSGAAVSGLPLVADTRDLGSFDLVSTISAGYPGAKEWVQYGREAMKADARLTSGSTGVQASQLFPYYPAQLNGILVAVKGAAEYETLVTEKYPVDRNAERLEQGRVRMGPQLVAHLLMIALIVLGNIAMIASRGTQGGAR
jgi:hypothetical protein